MEKQQQIDYSSELQQLRNSLDSLHIDIDKQSKVTADKLSNLKLENKNSVSVDARLYWKTISNKAKYN